MSNHETAAITKIQLLYSPEGWRLFRNSVGMGWVGKILDKVHLPSGTNIRISGAVLKEFGLILPVKKGKKRGGSSDLIGWRPVKITAEMVGKTISQFTAIEVKTFAYKKITDLQNNFLDQVKASGGHAVLITGLENGELDVKEW